MDSLIIEYKVTIFKLKSLLSDKNPQILHFVQNDSILH